jgi:hypothetical protein
MPVSDDLDSGAGEQIAASVDLPADIDLEELARRVAELLFRELEIENDRTGRC